MGLMYRGRHTGTYGTTLAQVFAVRIKKKIDAGEKCQLYGTISVADVEGVLHIYNREPNDLECVDEGGTLSLNAVQRALHAYKSFTLCLDLMDKNGSEFIKKSLKLDLTRGNPEWRNMLDRLLVYDVVGVKGEARVYLSVLRVAVLARIRAKFEFKTSKSVKVSGMLVGRYGKRFDHGGDDMKENCSFILFNKGLEECVHLKNSGVEEGAQKKKAGVVEKDDKIDVLRPVVAIPAYSSFIFEANFHCVYCDGDEEREECIVDCKEVSGDQINLEHVKFEGVYGRIVVMLSDIGPSVPGC